MFHRFANTIMILIIFTTQVTEAFAVSKLPCADDDMKASMSTMMDHSTHNMNQSMHHVMGEENSGESIDDEKCCQKDCCCPMGIVAAAVIFGMPFTPSFDVRTTQPLNNDSNIIDIFLTQPQRPPIFILS